jgi:hypothetical protein
MTQQDRDFLTVLARSPDRGDGWRSVSKTCWQLVEDFAVKELIEVDQPNMRIRLTSDGIAVVKFAL